jgi:hypothetical protein
MTDDRTKVLAKVQADYDFYIRLQETPDAALANYDLSPEEKNLTLNPVSLGAALYGFANATGDGDGDPSVTAFYISHIHYTGGVL